MKKLILIAVITAILSPSLAFSADNSGEKTITKKKSTQSRGIITKRDGNWSKIKDLFM